MEPRLEIAKATLLDALRHLRLGGRARGAELLVGFDGRCLKLDSQGMQLGIPATGRWPGTARIPSRPLDALVRVPPAGENLVLRFTGGRCYFGSFSVSGFWQDIGPEPIDLPLNADLRTVLSCSLRLNDTQITGSALAQAVDDAWNKANHLIREAAKVLTPLGIETEDLRWLLRRKLEDDGGTGAND